MPNSDSVTLRDINRLEHDVALIKNDMLPDIYDKINRVERQNYIFLGVGAIHLAVVIFLLNKVFDLQRELNLIHGKRAVAELIVPK